MLSILSPREKNTEVVDLERQAAEVRQRLDKTFEDIQDHMDPAYQLGTAFAAARSSLSNGTLFNNSKYKMATWLLSKLGLKQNSFIAAVGSLAAVALMKKIKK